MSWGARSLITSGDKRSTPGLVGVARTTSNRVFGRIGDYFMYVKSNSWALVNVRSGVATNMATLGDAGGAFSETPRYGLDCICIKDSFYYLSFGASNAYLQKYTPSTATLTTLITQAITGSGNRAYLDYDPVTDCGIVAFGKWDSSATLVLKKFKSDGTVTTVGSPPTGFGMTLGCSPGRANFFLFDTAGHDRGYAGYIDLSSDAISYYAGWNPNTTHWYSSLGAEGLNFHDGGSQVLFNYDSTKSWDLGSAYTDFTVLGLNAAGDYLVLAQKASPFVSLFLLASGGTTVTLLDSQSPATPGTVMASTILRRENANGSRNPSVASIYSLEYGYQWPLPWKETT